MDQFVYKILSEADWGAAETGGVSKTALDENDGYVHLSTRAQVAQTLELHYKGADQVRLLEFKLEKLAGMGHVRWEPSRGGALFPHLYGKLQINAAERLWVLNLDSEEIPQLPGDLSL